MGINATKSFTLLAVVKEAQHMCKGTHGHTRRIFFKNSSRKLGQNFDNQTKYKLIAGRGKGGTAHVES